MPRDYILKESYDNSLPLFIGGESHGEIRIVPKQPKQVSAGGSQYERWSLTSGREFVFYRLLGMTDAAAFSALVNLALKGGKLNQPLSEPTTDHDSDSFQESGREEARRFLADRAR